MNRKSKTKKILHKVGSELRDNPPRIVEKTRREKGPEAAEKQRKAILLSKARRAGARIPYKSSKSKGRSRKRAINMENRKKVTPYTTTESGKKIRLRDVEKKLSRANKRISNKKRKYIKR